MFHEYPSSGSWHGTLCVAALMDQVLALSSMAGSDDLTLASHLIKTQQRIPDLSTTDFTMHCTDWLYTDNEMLFEQINFAATFAQY